jgi:hypothetical protein
MMPSVSKKQQRFMGAEYGRAKEGKDTRTGMSQKQLRDYASGPIKKKPRR